MAKKGRIGDRYRKVKISKESVKTHNKKQYAKIAILALFLFVITLGGSYAIFTMTINGNKTTEVVSGTLTIEYLDKNEINLDKAYPMSNEEGLNTTPYTFTIKNTGTLNGKYTISVEEKDKNTLDKSYIKYSIREENGQWSTPVLLSSGLVLKENVIIESKKETTYELKMWLDENAPNEVQGKTYSGKIVVSTVQTNSNKIVTASPIIELNGEKVVTVEENETYTDAGVSRIISNENLSIENITTRYEYYDGTNTQEVESIDTSKIGSYYIYYEIEDSKNNIGITSRVVNVKKKDTNIPTITLKGESLVSLDYNEEYIEAGYNATDIEDGDLTDKVVVVGTVNKEIAGTYVIKYIVIDGYGNTSSVTREVIVNKKSGTINLESTTKENKNITTEITIEAETENEKMYYAVTNSSEKPNDSEYQAMDLVTSLSNTKSISPSILLNKKETEITKLSSLKKFRKVVEIVKNGTYYIYIKDNKENIESKTVTVTNIDETKPSCLFSQDIYVGKNKTKEFILTCTDPADITNETLTKDYFEIGNTNILDITTIESTKVENGYQYKIGISGKQAGTTNIKLLQNKISDQVGNINEEVTKEIKVTDIDVNNVEVKLDLNDINTSQIEISGTNAGNITYTSSNDSVATVNDVGFITAISPGTATIIVEEENGKVQKEILVTVVRTLTVLYHKPDTGVTLIGATKTTCEVIDESEKCSIDLPDITAETGYSVLGWFEGNDKFGNANQQDVEISSNKELEAKAELEYYHVTVTISEGIESFDIAGGAEGTLLTEQTSYSDDNAYQTEFMITNIKTKKGYSYKGYTLNGSLKEIDGSSNDTIRFKLGAGDGSINLKSQINSYTVTYDYVTNGGISSTKETATLNYNKSIDLTPTATKEGYTFVGWNTSKDATTTLSSLTMGTSNVTLYAIYKKEVTITFNKNGAVSQTVNEGIASTEESVTVSCTLYNNEGCKVTAPSIEASSATPTVIGYSKSADDHTSSWNVSTEKEVKENATYYAQTMHEKTTNNVIYTKQGTGVSTIGSTSDSCSIAATYNGKVQEPSCKVTLPSITVAEGYTSKGWNEDATAHDGILPDTEIELNKDTTTYYTISRKDEVTLTASFNKNGAASQTVSGVTSSTEESVTVSCQLEESFNTETETTECNIITPSIEASTVTPIVVGYAENKDATEASIEPNTSLTLSSNKTYYAITKSSVKTYTATFNKNGAASQTVNGGSASTADNVTQSCNIPITYNGTSQANSCSVTTPSITASTATPTVCGYTTTSTGTSACSVKVNTSISLSSNVDYYAQTYKAVTSKTAIFKIASTTKVSKITSGSKSVANTTDSIPITCTIAATYNGSAQATSCNVTAPNITEATGYQNPFWGTSTTSTSGNVSGATLTISGATTYYANANITSHTVTYDATTNGGTTTATTKTVNYNSAIDLTPTASKTGYTFKGWNTTKTATTGLSSLKMGTSNVTLYAIFVDDTSPKCSWSTSSTIGLNATATLTLTCEDTGSGITSAPTLATSDFTVTTKGSITSVSGPTTVTTSQKYSYTVSVKGINAGTFTVTLPASKVSDAAGNKNAAVTSSAVTVNKGTTSPTVNMSGYTYGGTKSTPTISGNTSGGTVTYYYNTTNSNSGGTAWTSVTSSTSLNAGTYYMYAVVAATDDYNAVTTATKSFTISKASGSVSLSATSGTTTYGTASKTFTVTGNTSGGTLSVSDDNSTATSSISGTTVTIGSLGSINAGTSIKVTVTSAATTNYNAASASYTLTINKANISPTVSMSGYTFTGTKSTPSISGNTGSGTVTYYYNTSNSNSGGTAWSNVTSSSSLAVGTYYMYATVAATTNYNAATTAAVAFKISGITRSVTFYSNGNTLSTPSGCAASGTNRVCSCTTTGTSTSCSITAPTITAPSNTPTVIGFSTGSTNRTKSVASGASVTLSSNLSYYAQTTKAAVTYTVTYTKQGTGVTAIGSTSSSCSIAASYNGTAQGTSCSVTAPSITVSSGYTAVGWNTSSTATTGTAASGTITLSGNATYYSISYKNAINKTLYFKTGTNVSSISGTTSNSCTIPAAYNNNTQGTSCTVTGTSPSITANTGYTQQGFYTSTSYSTLAVKASTSYSISLTQDTNYYAYAKDVTAPTTPTITATSNNGSSIGLTFTSGTDTGSGMNSHTCEYGTTSSYGTTSTLSSTATSCTFSTSVGTLYYYRICAKDKAGNSSCSSGSLTTWTGIPSGTYTTGSTVTYGGASWYVVSDNGSTVTLISAGNIGTGNYSSTPTTVNSYISNNAVLKADISLGALTNASIPSRTAMPKNSSGTPFWTNTPSGTGSYYILGSDGSTNGHSYTKYTLSASTRYYATGISSYSSKSLNTGYTSATATINSAASTATSISLTNSGVASNTDTIYTASNVQSGTKTYTASGKVSVSSKKSVSVDSTELLSTSGFVGGTYEKYSAYKAKAVTVTPPATTKSTTYTISYCNSSSGSTNGSLSVSSVSSTTKVSYTCAATGDSACTSCGNLVQNYLKLCSAHKACHDKYCNTYANVKKYALQYLKNNSSSTWSVTPASWSQGSNTYKTTSTTGCQKSTYYTLSSGTKTIGTRVVITVKER